MAKKKSVARVILCRSHDVAIPYLSARRLESLF